MPKATRHCQHISVGSREDRTPFTYLGEIALRSANRTYDFPHLLRLVRRIVLQTIHYYGDVSVSHSMSLAQTSLAGRRIKAFDNPGCAHIWGGKFIHSYCVRMLFLHSLLRVSFHPSRLQRSHFRLRIVTGAVDDAASSLV